MKAFGLCPDCRKEYAVSEHHHSHDHDHTEPPSDLVLRVQALESLLIEKGLVDPAAIDVLIDNVVTHTPTGTTARVSTQPSWVSWSPASGCASAHADSA